MTTSTTTKNRDSLPRYINTTKPLRTVVPIDQHTAITRHQFANNAISTATWHLNNGRTEQALGRIISAARHLKQACTESATNGRA